jgi:hypothetical protein
VVGRERVIAGSDCGFSSFDNAQPEVHRPWYGPNSRRWPRVHGWRANSCGAGEGAEAPPRLPY